MGTPGRQLAKVLMVRAQQLTLTAFPTAHLSTKMTLKKKERMPARALHTMVGIRTLYPGHVFTQSPNTWLINNLKSMILAQIKQLEQHDACTEMDDGMNTVGYEKMV